MWLSLTFVLNVHMCGCAEFCWMDYLGVLCQSSSSCLYCCQCARMCVCVHLCVCVLSPVIKTTQPWGSCPAEELNCKAKGDTDRTDGTCLHLAVSTMFSAVHTNTEQTVSFTEQHGICVHASPRAYRGRWLSSLSSSEMQHQYAANSILMHSDMHM